MKSLNRMKWVALLMPVLLVSCNSQPKESKSVEVKQTLKSVFANDFLVGAALGEAQINGEFPAEVTLIQDQFSSLTGENCMKWERIHPQADSFNFVLPDKLVALAEKNNQTLIGHTLVWHNQVPDWVFEDSDGNLIGKDELFARMSNHITTVASRYRGKIMGWDVVNEALNEDGTFRQSKYYQISGEDYIYKAFELAKQADPEMELYYNDYNMHRADKVDGAIALAKKIREKGLQIDGIGMQGHWGIDGPPVEEIEASILKINAAGLKVMITELDIDVLPNPRNIEGANLDDSFESNAEANPYVGGLPDSVNQVHADRYRDLFALFYKHRDKISRVTFWGVHDGQSWKNNWPARGRTNYCLVFDREFQPKLAYDQILAIKP